MKSIEKQIALELNVRVEQVKSAVELLDGGSTVPLIARYRKEATGMLDDAQLRLLEERLIYLRELETRREAIIVSIRDQGKLDEALEAQIKAADSKARLEDIYLPYKPKRRTKAQIAREAGLQPLAEAILANPEQKPEISAADFVNNDKGVADITAALDGARAILVENFAEDADLIGELREAMWQRGRLVSKVRENKQEIGSKFSDYFDSADFFTKLTAHRILALFRGEKEEVLDLVFEPEEGASLISAVAAAQNPSWFEQKIASRFGIADRGRAADKWLRETVRWAWRTRIQSHLAVDIRARLWQFAEDASIKVFASNLRDLLLAAPAGTRATMGLDPGFRTGVKVAVVDGTGKILDTTAIYPHEPQRQWAASLGTLAELCKKHKVELIAIGNGTASRETDKLAGELIQLNKDLKLTKIVVSEAGASVYSASAYASAELPNLDVSIRGAVSIARRLQDPLAELVKIDPKSIGVGQYQHDLSEHKLSRSLDAVVEDCVNAVGVDVNTASVPLLARVSGINKNIAENIVSYRNEHGAFPNRMALQNVSRLGAKTFEQAAGFLRIPNGDNPLDASAVHPEAYALVNKIERAAKIDIKKLIGNAPVLRGLSPKDFVDNNFGLPTVTDILKELEKPGRDPRPSFKTATFKEGIEKISDLKAGMVLEGVVTNVAAFGAFIDIGVHQDGLVHISALSKNFIKDPREVIKPGDIAKVKILEIDIPRKRISLTLRLDDEIAGASSSQNRVGPNISDKGRSSKMGFSKNSASRSTGSKTQAGDQSSGGNPFADAFNRAGLNPKR